MYYLLLRAVSLVIAIWLLWEAYLFSSWHQPFPFGNSLSFAITWAAGLAMWSAFRIQNPFERKIIIAAAVGGCVSAWLAMAIGVLYEIVFTKGNLNPIIAIFVVGPVGFIVGSLGAAALTARYFSHRRNS